MEQDRAQVVFLHQPELAWPTAGEPGCDRQPDRGYSHQQRPEGPLRIGPGPLPRGAKNHGRSDGHTQHRARDVSWRLELHAPSTKPQDIIGQLFINSPLALRESGYNGKPLLFEMLIEGKDGVDP